MNIPRTLPRSLFFPVSLFTLIAVVGYRLRQLFYSDIKGADAFGGVLGLPTTFVIGRDNRIHVKHNGVTNFSSLEQEVVAQLKAGQN